MWCDVTTSYVRLEGQLRGNLLRLFPKFVSIFLFQVRQWKFLYTKLRVFKIIYNYICYKLNIKVVIWMQLIFNTLVYYFY